MDFTHGVSTKDGLVVGTFDQLQSRLSALESRLLTLLDSPLLELFEMKLLVGCSSNL